MNVSPSIAHKAKAGTCPHGLPLGACPICNGMGGGGGGGSAKKSDKPEMSWSECYVMWQQMQKAKQAPKGNPNEAIQAQMISQYKMQLSIGAFAQKIGNLTDKMSNFIKNASYASSFGDKLLAFSARLALPVLNSIKNIASFADKALNAIKGKFIDISDKLNAMFGELKNAIEKKISDKLKDFKKKIKSLFGILDPENVDDIEDEEKKIEDEKRIFETKTFIHSLKQKFSEKLSRKLFKRTFTPNKSEKELEYGFSD